MKRSTTMINAVMTALLEELGDEIPDILNAEFSLACLWADLCRIAGEPVPADVAAVLDAPLGFVPVMVPEGRQRNSMLAYAD
jgi:hypothetical protein